MKSGSRTLLCSSDQSDRSDRSDRLRLKASGMRLGSFVPEGHLTIARRFNAGEATKGTLVPKGRLRTLLAFSRPFGTDLLLGSAHPALKRRAIVGSPFGAKRHGGLADSLNRTWSGQSARWGALALALALAPLSALAQTEGGLVLDPILPGPLVALLAAVLLVLSARIYFKVGGTLGAWRRWSLLLFRAAGLALVLALLLQPSRRELLPPPSRERVTLIGLDTSLSMKQRDAERATRLDAAKNALLNAGLVGRNGVPENPRLRFFEFGPDAQPVVKSILDLTPKGPTTRLNSSVLTMLNTPAGSEEPNALILLTDGHDFELVNPARTGAAARARQVPIYAVPLGKQGKVRDVSVRITAFQPYCYVKQNARIAAALRLIGCEFEDLTVQLLRQGQVVQTKRVNAEELQELPVEFEVAENQVGQYEYEVRVPPLDNEVDTANNSAITYLNVIDQQIHVLVIEGDPYWDTTFLQRSLMRNDKFDVDALIRYSRDRVRALRKTELAGPLRVPQTLEQFSHYDVIFLGRMVDRVLTPAQVVLLDRYARDCSGTVIFGRGSAFVNPAAAGELEPVLWGDKAGARVRLDATAEGRNLGAFRALGEGAAGLETLPDLLSGRKAAVTKPLTSTLALAADREDGAAAPAVVHRRYGTGQVVSVGVEGFWRWGLNSKADGLNTPFDRFWDQMILWLLAGRDFIPSRQFSFRPNSANILLGEKVYFHVTMRQADPKVAAVPLTLYLGEAEVGRVNMMPATAQGGRRGAEFLPERVGRYRAVAKFPDGTLQESRFIVFNENLEETEVATDVVGLRRLCESSGGSLVEAGQLARLIKELSAEENEAAPQAHLCPVWNQAWVFYLAGLLLGLDWFLRRRWGLC